MDPASQPGWRRIQGGCTIDPVLRSYIPGLEALGRTLSIAVLQADGIITYASTRLYEALAEAGEVLEGHHWVDYVHKDDQERLVEACEALGQPASELSDAVVEWRARPRPGAPDAWFESRITTVAPEDDVLGFVVATVETTESRRAHAELARSERRLDKVVNGSKELVTILARDGTFAWSSTDLVLGYEERFVPDDMFDYVHPDDRERLATTFARALERRSSWKGGVSVTYRALHRDGGWRWLETIATDLLDDEDVKGIVLHSRDVTGRQEAMERIRTVTSSLETLVASLTLAVAMVGPDGRYAVVNQGFVDLLVGLGMEDADDVVGRHEAEVTASILRGAPDAFGDPGPSLRRRRDIVERRTLVVDERIPSFYGRTYARTFIPISIDGQPAGHVWLYRDLTDELTAEAERERLLATEVEQNRRLLELAAARSDLLASISHELRTPLASVIMYTELLREGVGHDTPDEQVQHLDVVARNMDRLLRSVDDLLVVDRLELHELAIERSSFGLPEAIEIAITSILPLAREKGVAVRSHLGGGPPVEGDPQRLGQLLDNLLTNAVKFTPAGGQVEVAATYGDDWWTLTVSDTGIGIPYTEIDRVFHRSFRGSNARQHGISGSGLGLTIARRLVELHGGVITVSSREEEGTTFTVRLPAGKQPS